MSTSVLVAMVFALCFAVTFMALALSEYSKDVRRMEEIMKEMGKDRKGLR
ncbi:MAG: hypothetical protein SOW44_09070 [Porphyromonas sp.]|nr:hypothetical protein [Bacteroidales bacterium]MDD7559321.1 hypothetical protein [Bacteroidales bacterium]MDY3101472.1 hypothetical protein [Porphyromonas sp.]